MGFFERRALRRHLRYEITVLSIMRDSAYYAADSMRYQDKVEKLQKELADTPLFKMPEWLRELYVVLRMRVVQRRRAGPAEGD